MGVTVPLNTVFMDLSVKDTSPTRASDIANEIAQQSIVVIEDPVSFLRPPRAVACRDEFGHRRGHDHHRDKSGHPSEVVGSAQMAGLIRHLVSTGATVILDTPPLLPATDPALLAQFTDGALLVTRVRSTRVYELTVGASAQRGAGAALLGVVVIRVPQRSTGLFRTSTYGYGFGRTSQPPQPQPLTTQDWEPLQGRTSAQQTGASARTSGNGQYRRVTETRRCLRQRNPDPPSTRHEAEP